MVSGCTAKLVLHDLCTQQLLRVVDGYPIKAVGALLEIPELPRACVSGSDDEYLRLWDLRSCTPTLKVHAGGAVGCLERLPNGLLLSGAISAEGKDGMCRLWDLRRFNQSIAAYSWRGFAKSTFCSSRYCLGCCAQSFGPLL